MAASTGESAAAAWTSEDFAEPREWEIPLTPAMLDEIDAALRAAEAAGVAGDLVAPADFPLAETAALLERLRGELEDGSGFVLLSGFPVERYGYAQNRLAFCGLSAHLARIAPQTHLGDTIIDVTDRHKPYDHTQRGYHSDQELPFHTDGADYVGLMCLGQAVEGGLSLLVCAETVHRMIAAERPDLMEVLRHGFFHHRRGEQAPGEPAVSQARVPVFSFHNGLLHCCYNRNPIEWARREGIALRDREIEALDFFDAVCRRPGVALRMALRPGDIQFVNNFTVLHSRTHYADGPGHTRHLLRIWLNNPDSRRAGPTLLNLYAPYAARAGLFA